MGSRKTRLANEALRQQQAAIITDKRKTERQDLALIVKNLLYDYHTAQTEMGDALREELATYFNNLRQDTSNLLYAFEAEHQEMARALRDYLEKYINNLELQEQARRNQNWTETCDRLKYLLNLLDLDFGLSNNNCPVYTPC